MKICLGKEIEEIKKKNSEAEKNLLKNRNSENVNELDENEDDVYFHSNAVKNIKLGSQLVNRIYLNNSIVYDLEDTIESKLFHSLVPKASATSIIFDIIENQDISNYNLVGYCDANNHIAVYNNNTEYLILNIRNAVIYSPNNSFNFFANYNVLINCVFSNFNTLWVTDMQYMFYDCSSLTSLDVSSFNTQNVKTMKYMFAGCRSLTSLDLSSFNTQNVTVIGSMFYNCPKLTSLDLSSFNTQNVTDMQYMFYVCSSLTSLDLSSFNTQNVKTMNNMFAGCSSLTSLDVSSFNTQNVTDMKYMFNNCLQLTSLDLSSFNTQNVKTMNNMFAGCIHLLSIISNTFSVLSLTSSNNMFYHCTQLIGGNGTTFSSSHTNAEYARVDGENGLPGYFTAPAANNNK